MEKHNEAATVSQDHWAALAATRFFLALIVVHVHYRIILPAPGEHPTVHLAMGLGGTAAVYGFLLISGFSIAHSFSGGEDGFYRRRIARLWPVLAVGVALYELANFQKFGHFDARWALTGLPTLFFLNGFVAPIWMNPTWSLPLEALFYVATPLLNRSMAAVAPLAAASAVLHFFNQELAIGPYPFLMFGIGALGVFWAWGVGFLAYRYLGRPQLAFLALVIGPLMIGAYSAGDGAYAALTWAVAVFAVFFGGSVHLTPGVQKAANYLGDLSYPLFITHFAVQQFAYNVQIMSWFFVLPLCLIVAAATLHLVDRPLRRAIGASRLFGQNPERFAPYILALVAIACVVKWLARA